MTALLPAPAARPLGRTGLAASPLAWGMWRFAGRPVAEAQRLVEAALAAGITLFDTADIYGFDETGFGAAESLLGAVLAGSPGLRDGIVLATKGGITPPVPYDSSRDHLMRALDASLARLGVERVDLYQIHRPDMLAHPQEVARTLEDMVASGKVAAIGVSNHSAAQTRALAALLSVPLASLQPELSPLAIAAIEDGLADLAMERDYAVLAWSPLGGGRIARPDSAREHAVADALDAVAQGAGGSRTAAAYSWIMAHPMRAIPIVGSQQAARIAEAAAALTVRWTREAWYRVLVAARGVALP